MTFTRSDYRAELDSLRPEDPSQYTDIIQEFLFIATGGHGFLVVPKDHEHAKIAKSICQGYGYRGERAYYLEEDCQAGEFLKKIKQ